jgi:hypothetical protein
MPCRRRGGGGGQRASSSNGDSSSSSSSESFDSSDLDDLDNSASDPEIQVKKAYREASLNVSSEEVFFGLIALGFSVGRSS